MSWNRFCLSQLCLVGEGLHLSLSQVDGKSPKKHHSPSYHCNQLDSSFFRRSWCLPKPLWAAARPMDGREPFYDDHHLIIVVYDDHHICWWWWSGECEHWQRGLDQPARPRWLLHPPPHQLCQAQRTSPRGLAFLLLLFTVFTFTFTVKLSTVH